MDALCRKFPETMTYIRPFLIKKACLDEDDED